MCRLEDLKRGVVVEGTLVPPHMHEVRSRRESDVERTIAAVKDRLMKEINCWDNRAVQLKDKELAGKVNAKINSGKARERADELQARLQNRLGELEQERQIAALPPVVVGGSIVVPSGVLKDLKSSAEGPDTATADAEARKEIKLIAMSCVMEEETNLGFEPWDVSDQKCGYDIESRVPGEGRLRFIEVKGRSGEADSVTVTNEILTALNEPDGCILAICVVSDTARSVHYVRTPFHREPDFGAESVNYRLDDLLKRSHQPA